MTKSKCMYIPAISVVMSVYNDEEFVAEAIESILAQSFEDFEFLILNDGSDDDSAAIINKYAVIDSRIVPIHRENRGFIASLNELVELTKAPIIARMDSDDISWPERFARQATFLANNPAYGVVGTAAVEIDEKGMPLPGRYWYYPETHEDFVATIGKGPLIAHPAVMMRRNFIQEVKGYRPIFQHCEDLDLWLRLVAVTRICSLPDVLYSYRRSASQVSCQHCVAQQIGAAIALLAYHARTAGCLDPTENLTELPSLDTLDSLFGQKGLDRYVRAKVVPGFIYSEVALRSSEAFCMILQHIRDGGDCSGFWKTVLRLLLLGEFRRAIELFRYLVEIKFRIDLVNGASGPK